MPIINPPISEDIQEDSWKQQATELIRTLEAQVQKLQTEVAELQAQVQ
jgi:hypothetical protein